MRNCLYRFRGFTLVELMIATIIVGILVAISIPLYLRQAEQAMASKALENIQSIFNAEMLYMADNATFTNNVADLQHYAPIPSDDADWSYAISNAGFNTFTITATRQNSTLFNGSISMDQDSVINGLPWPP